MQETPSVQGGSGDGNEVPSLLGIIEGAVKAAQKTREVTRVTPCTLKTEEWLQIEQKGYPELASPEYLALNHRPHPVSG